MVYASEVITDALSMIDVIAASETPEAFWMQLGKRALNGLFGQWQTKGIYNPLQVTGEFTTTTPTNLVTVGVDNSDPLNPILGDIPIDFGDISHVQVSQGNIVYRLTKGTYAEYLAHSVKNTTSIPNFYSYDYQRPIGKLNFYPTLLGGLKVTVNGKKAIKLLSTDQEDTAFDDIYYDALLFNLAASLYPHHKSAAGIDKEIIYKAKASVEGLRAKSIAQRMKSVHSPYYSATPTQSYWLSSLNSVSQ